MNQLVTLIEIDFVLRRHENSETHASDDGHFQTKR